MSSSGRKPAPSRSGRVVGAAFGVTLGLVGCSEPGTPDPSGITAEDLQQVQEEVARLEDRVATLEDQVSAMGSTDPADGSATPSDERTFFGDPGSFVGEEVTVRGRITELLASTDVASAFRIAGDTGDPVGVVSATPSPEVAAGDVVEVTGTAVEVASDTFEADFGIAADAVFGNPEAWLSGAEGQVALAAVRIEAAPAPAGD